MPLVSYTVEPPRLKWRVAMDAVRVNAVSLEQLRFRVSADSEGKPYDPTSGTFEAAFLDADAVDPGPSDWHPGTWDTTVIGTYAGQALVGTGGIALAKGHYFVWVRITAAPEIVVRQVGELDVD
jgi:hypothetical protein